MLGSRRNCIYFVFIYDFYIIQYVTLIIVTENHTVFHIIINFIASFSIYYYYSQKHGTFLQHYVTNDYYYE